MDILLDDITIKTMSELELTQKEFWNVPRETGLAINTFLKMINAQNVLEIGTSNGYSGLWITKALKQTGGKLTTIEYYEKRQNVALQNFEKCGVIDIVTPIIGDAAEVISNFSSDVKFDAVFIDANKKDYVRYFELLKSHLTDKALILADNIISHYQKVKPFIAAIDNDKDFQYQILELPGGLLIAFKN